MVKLQNTVTKYVSISAPYNKVFDYLTNPLLYKEWSTNFIADVIPENDEHYAVTPMGKVKFAVKGDKQTGNIDLFFGDAPLPISTRLFRNAEGVTYLFTLFQADSMPDQEWESGIAGLIEELELLKNKF
jgi:hypothetical protein